jgi:hypothetical protein
MVQCGYLLICWGVAKYYVIYMFLPSPVDASGQAVPWYPDPRNETRISARSQHEPMLENRIHAQLRRSGALREFFLPVEVYISNQAAAALRKVLLSYLATTCRPSVVHKTAQPAEEG